MAGVAASAADLVPSDNADAVLLAICARAEEADRLLRDADRRSRELSGELAQSTWLSAILRVAAEPE